MKHAVYVLPSSTQALEDLAWLRREVEARGGQAAVFTASAVEDLGDADIVEQFRAARADDYKALLADMRKRFPRVSARTRVDTRDLRPWRERVEAIRQIDFFGAPGGADVESFLSTLERAALERQAPPTDASRPRQLERSAYIGRRWVTRPRPGVDRFASAWLIRRFIDPAATFLFAAPGADTADAIPFDMYEHIGFGHDGDRCTFEVLQSRFAIADRAVSQLAEIVHDVDLKDDRFHARHASTVELLVSGLRASFTDDDILLEQGMVFIDALYRALSAIPASPRGGRSQR